jgi:hypothetical protein
MLVNLSRRTFVLTGSALIVPTFAAGRQQGGPGVSAGPGPSKRAVRTLCSRHRIQISCGKW